MYDIDAEVYRYTCMLTPASNRTRDNRPNLASLEFDNNVNRYDMPIQKAEWLVSWLETSNLTCRKRQLQGHWTQQLVKNS